MGKSSWLQRGGAMLGLLGVLAVAAEVVARDDFEPKMIHCKLRYDLSGWSFFYKTMKGEGRITCDNGQSVDVLIKLNAGGFTAGRSEVVGGRGVFTEGRNLDELLGMYAHAGGHAGATKSASASVVSKGTVSLALAGEGRGVDLGITLGAFSIERKRASGTGR